MITLFKEITTEEALQEIEKESEKWDGLYCDMNNKEERKFVKDNAVKIESIRKKVDRARIDKSKNYKIEVEAEAKSIDARLVEANKPFISLIDDHKEKRAKILAADKLRTEILECHEEAFLIDRELIIEAKELAAKLKEEKEEKAAREKKIADDAAAQAKLDAEAKTAKAIQDKLDAEAATKQAVIDKKVAEELAVKQKAEAEEKAEAAKAKAAKDKIAAAKKATQDEKDRQEDVKAAAEKKRLKVEADKKHVGKILKEIKEQVMKDSGVDEASVKKVLLSINKIKRIKIDFM